MALAKFSDLYPSFMDRFFGPDLFDWSSRNFSTTNTTLPSINIMETDGEYEVEMAAPGLSKKDFKIELNNDMLTISCEKEFENEVKDDQHYSLREFSYQSFTRSFALPETADSEKVAARYENGILKLVIPKKEEAKRRPPRKIEIH